MQGSEEVTEIRAKMTDLAPCVVHSLAAGHAEDRAVLLLHGMKFQAATWEELGTLAKLARSGLHAIALDMPGFGKSEACALSQDAILEGFLRKNDLVQPVLVGPSMGGRIALEFTLNHPELIGGLVLVGAVGVEENKDRLAEIRVPTLIVWGSRDTISPLTNCTTLCTSIQGARQCIIEGAPHPCYLKQPEIWHTALLQFLGTL